MRTTMAIAVLAVFLAAPAAADNPFKEGGEQIGQGAKKIGKETGHAFKEGGKQTGHAFKEGGKEIGHGFKEGGKEIGHGFKKMGTETGQAAKKTGTSVGGWFREAGAKTGKAFRQMGRDIRNFFAGTSLTEPGGGEQWRKPSVPVVRREPASPARPAAARPIPTGASRARSWCPRNAAPCAA